MIHRSTAKPYQYGFIYLGGGFYLTVDPIGWIICKIENGIQAIRKRPGYYHHVLHWWDTLYSRIGIPKLWYRFERWRWGDVVKI